MRTVHFVYVLPVRAKILGRVFRRFFHMEIFRGAISDYTWPIPLKAPHSITYYLGKYLEGRYRVKLYDLRERITICPEPGDILLGHLWPDRQTVMWNSISDPRFSKKYLIEPYNNDEEHVGWLRDGLQLCDGLFAICGDYWIDNFSQTPLKGFENKISHLNMAVDTSNYPLVKTEFNPPGKRRFLYIGRHGQFGDEKGIGLLEELSKSIPGFQGGYICTGGEIKGWKKISPPLSLTTDLMKEIASEYDVFINMSRADAQATTILEAMSWGFPVACTNQSGYNRESNFFYLSLDDMEHNFEMFHKIQNLPDHELKVISLANRSVVENKYGWDRFVSNFNDF